MGIFDYFTKKKQKQTANTLILEEIAKSLSPPGNPATIDTITPRSGRILGEDGQVYNFVDLMKALTLAVAGSGIGSDDGGGVCQILWKPSVDEDGTITWTLSASTTPPNSQNIRGLPGVDGADGLQGERGEQGQPGERGEQGLPGIDGNAGQCMWVIPDFSNQQLLATYGNLSVSNGVRSFTFTASDNGFVRTRTQNITATRANGAVFINSHQVAGIAQQSSVGAWFDHLLPIAKGDVVRCTGMASSGDFVWFVPMRVV